MKRNVLIGYLALVFAAGVGAGALGLRYATVSAVNAKAPPRTPEEFRKAYTAEMTERLKLSTDQVQKLSSILDQTGARMRELRERTRPEMKVIQDDQVKLINGILDDSQQAEYARMREERERKRSHDKGGR
ncbi:MAG: hypothetical protein IT161_24025 [Bryobacterales bacterium]|nr:hypothetical protein [Bryobacterales bacterium]